MSKAAEKYADEVLAIVALKKPDQFRQLSHGAINDLRATMINSYCAGAKDCEAIQAKLDKAERSAHILVRGIKQSIEDNGGDCDCGFDESLGEGYTGGICTLHESLSIYENINNDAVQSKSGET